MSITVIAPPNTPANFQAQLQDGGSLSPNTTYYFRIVAKNYGFYCSSGSWENRASEPSIIVGVITTDTMKQVYLSWEKVSGCDYYDIGFSADQVLWYSIKIATENYTKYASVQGDCNITFSNAVSQKGIYRKQLYEYPNVCPISKTLGIGSIYLSGSCGIVTMSDLKNAVNAAGLTDEYFKWDGVTLYSRMHIFIAVATTGSMNNSYLNIYLIQCLYYNDSSNFTLTETYTRISINCWSWRFPTQRRVMYACVLLGQESAGLSGANAATIMGGDNYVNVYNDTNWLNCTVIKLIVQHYNGATSNLLNVEGQISVKCVPSSKITIKDSRCGDYYFPFIDGDMTNIDKTLLEVRNLQSYWPSKDGDIRIHTVMGIVRIYDFKGEQGKAVNGSYNRPAIYWSGGYTTKIYLYHELCLVIKDKFNNPIQGATVRLYDKDNNLVWNTTTGVEGKTEEDILATIVSYNGGTVYEDRYPLKLEIFKTGYMKYESKFDLDRRLDEVISLLSIERKFDSLEA